MTLPVPVFDLSNCFFTGQTLLNDSQEHDQSSILAFINCFKNSIGVIVITFHVRFLSIISTHKSLLLSTYKSPLILTPLFTFTLTPSFLFHPLSGKNRSIVLQRVMKLLRDPVDIDKWYS